MVGDHHELVVFASCSSHREASPSEEQPRSGKALNGALNEATLGIDRPNSNHVEAVDNGNWNHDG